MQTLGSVTQCRGQECDRLFFAGFFAHAAASTFAHKIALF
jgi:hypothetical protein